MSWYSVTYLKKPSEIFGEERFESKYEALRFISQLSSDSVSLHFNYDANDRVRILIGTWVDGTNNVDVNELAQTLEEFETQTI